jgi:hypothetical protein
VGRDLRTYYDDGDRPEPIGVPKWSESKDPRAKCPNCKAQLCEIKVRVTLKRLKGGKGTASYLGCPACPYASQSLTVSDSA